LPGLINNIETAIFAKEVAPGRAGQACQKDSAAVKFSRAQSSLFVVKGSAFQSRFNNVMPFKIKRFQLSGIDRKAPDKNHLSLYPKAKPIPQGPAPFTPWNSEGQRSVFHRGLPRLPREIPKDSEAYFTGVAPGDGTGACPMISAISNK